MATKGDMTQGSPAKLIFTFSVPMILGNVVQQFYSFVDSAIVGRFIGKNALAAIGATQSVLLLMICLIIGLNVGTGIIAAQYFGAKNEKMLKDLNGTAVYVMFGLTAFIFVVGLIAVEPVMTLLNTPPEIIADAKVYLLINTCTSIAPIAYNLTACIMRSIGDSKSSLYALVVSSFMNIVLDLVFVVVFHWGVAGAAWATAISQAASAMYNLWRIKRKHTILHITRDNLIFRPSIMKEILRVGLPMTFQNAVASIGALGVQGFVNSYGTDAMAAYTAAGKIDQLAAFPLSSLGMAVSTYVGQNFGSRNMQRIKQGVRAGLIQAVLWGLGIMAIILLFGASFTKLFVSAEEVAVIEIAKEYLFTVAIFYWISGIMYVMLNSFRGIGDMKTSTLASCIDPVGRFIAAAILSHNIGRAGLWCGWPIGWGLCFLVTFIIWMLKWHQKEEI